MPTAAWHGRRGGRRRHGDRHRRRGDRRRHDGRERVVAGLVAVRRPHQQRDDRHDQGGEAGDEGRQRPRLAVPRVGLGVELGIPVGSAGAAGPAGAATPTAAIRRAGVVRAAAGRRDGRRRGVLAGGGRRGRRGHHPSGFRIAVAADRREVDRAGRGRLRRERREELGRIRVLPGRAAIAHRTIVARPPPTGGACPARRPSEVDDLLGRGLGDVEVVGVGAGREVLPAAVADDEHDRARARSRRRP